MGPLALDATLVPATVGEVEDVVVFVARDAVQLDASFFIRVQLAAIAHDGVYNSFGRSNPL